MDKSQIKQTILSTFLIFAFGMFGGCICINILWRVQDNLYENDWAFALDNMVKYVNKIPYFPDIQIAVWVLVPYTMIFVLGLWKYGKVLLQGFVLCCGFLVGGIETIWLLNYNLKDGIFFLFALGTRLNIFTILYLAVVILAITMSRVKTRRQMNRQDIKKYIFYSLFIMIILLVYLILCSYVNL